jgi:hypothetical protein
MSQREWEALTPSEAAFMINSYEFDILPGVWGDLAEADQSRPVTELAPILLSLVDRGWIQVHRVTSMEPELQLGPAVPRDQLSTDLNDPESWEYPEDGTYDDGLKLVLTEPGWNIVRRTPEEMAQSDRESRGPDGTTRSEHGGTSPCSPASPEPCRCLPR